MKTSVAKAAVIALLVTIVLLIKVKWLINCCEGGSIVNMLTYQFADFCLLLFFGIGLILIVFFKK